jgi:hypothetical protein
MKFKDETFPSVTFDEFCDANDLEVVVRERAGEYDFNRYYATIDRIDIKQKDELLVGIVGNGAVKEDAVRTYANLLAGLKIVRDSRETYRKELQCPNVWADETP